jgi:O-antigen/teichoic acid export membrane protein
MLLRKLIVQNIIWRGLYFFSLFLLNIIISRYFKADGSGEIYYIVNNLSFLLLIVSLSLESGAAYFISKNEISEQKTALFCMLWSVAVTLISLIFLKWMRNNSSNFVLPGNEYFVGCGCYILGVLLTTYFTPLFFAKKNFILPNLILLSLTLLLMALLMLYGSKPFVHRHFALIYLGSFLLQGLVLAVIYSFQNNVFKNPGLLSKYDLQKLFKYSFLALSGNIIFFLVYRVDYWFVNKNCSVAELGNYIQVSKLGQIFLLIPTAIASAIFINTASRKEQDIEFIKIISRLVTLLYFVIIIILLLSGKWLFPLIYGSTFNLMYFPFLLLSPGIVSLSTLALLTSYYAGRGQVMTNVKGGLFALVLILILNFIFSAEYGMYAAAAASSAGYILYQAYVIYTFKREYKGTSVTEFFIFQKRDLTFFKRKAIDNGKNRNIY